MKYFMKAKIIYLDLKRQQQYFIFKNINPFPERIL